MNILQAISSADPAHGGVMEGIRQTSLVLAQMGHHVEVASADDPAAPWLCDLGLTVHVLGPARSTYCYAPRMLHWLRVNAARFGTVIVCGLWQYHGRAVRHALRWPGMLTGDVKWGAFRAAEAFVLPSYQENFGIAVAEALACGLPVLISDKVNIWREVTGAGAGLVSEDTESGRARLLRDWLALAPEAREGMRRRALRCFSERFEIRHSAENLLRHLM